MSLDIFIVHGHDMAMRAEVANFVKEIGYNPVVLDDRPNRGRTIFEKFEEEAANIAFAIVLLSPDDFGEEVGRESNPNPRARQNVILELGYFVGKLGRERVCSLHKHHKGDVEIPSDMQGVLYISFDADGAWKVRLKREMEAVGLAAITDPVLPIQAIESDDRSRVREEIGEAVRLLRSALQRLELLSVDHMAVTAFTDNLFNKNPNETDSVLSPLPISTIGQVNLKLTGEYVLPEQPSRNRINVLKFTADGRFLIGGLNQDRVAIWDTATRELRNMDAPRSSLRWTESMDWPTYAISASPDGKFLATPTYDRTIQIWHFQGLKPYKLIETVNHRSISLTFSPDNQWLVAGLDEDGYIYSWSVSDDFRSVDHVQAHAQRVTALKFHPSQLNFVSCAVDGTIKHWEIVDENIISVRSYEGHDQEHVVDIAFSPDGKLLASGSVRGQIMLWEVETGNPIREFNHEQVVRTLVFSPDGKLLVSGANDRTLKIWSVSDGSKLRSKTFEYAVRTIDFSPDGHSLVVADDASKKAQIFTVYD